MSVKQIRGITPLKYFQKLKAGSVGAQHIFLWDEYITQRQLDRLIAACEAQEKVDSKVNP